MHHNHSKPWDFFGERWEGGEARCAGRGRGPRGPIDRLRQVRHDHHHGHHHGPFGHGPFGGGGPFAFFKRGTRAKRGDIRAGIIALLTEAPHNGYQIMQELEKRSRGLWRPSPGAVYPALQQLEDEGLIQAEGGGSGRVFALTDKGKEYAAANKDEVDAPWESVASAADEPMLELFTLMRGIGAALWQIAQSGNGANVAAAKKILTDTRRGLYRILAEDGVEDEGADSAE